MTKQNLHPNNIHNQGYDFALLTKANQDLTACLINQHDHQTIDFSDSNSVYQLNKALLLHHYRLMFWDIPKNNLCPAIPGRADYIHYLGDLVKQSTGFDTITGKKFALLDIGTGASLVYPILASKIFNWKAVASDIDETSLKLADNLVKANKLPIKLRYQPSDKNIFKGILSPDERFIVSCCNPPFHESIEQVQDAAKRKWRNLNHTDKSDGLNFSGQKAELYCDGGELQFISTMIKESASVKEQVLWFTTLVSKQKHLVQLTQQLTKLGITEHQVIAMSQGQKTSHILAWSFLPQAQHHTWFAR